MKKLEVIVFYHGTNLYLLSDRVIEQGDFYYNKLLGKMARHMESMAFFDFSCKKVEATSDSFMIYYNLPVIPTSLWDYFIENREAFRELREEKKTVLLDMDEGDVDDYTTWMSPAINDKDEVIITIK